MTPTRLIVILAVGLLFTDYKFGNGRLVDSISTQVVESGYKLNNMISQIVRRIAP
jgi:hypothetical protein